eukprot:gnl/MRDRNA2_/MRDRNA2_92330_c0_seq1.p2 gnl/MRDRNA2_/MRDRNA2_92330_c0~~gnl/MRDRNA2_/MRDRNA2_92330_c0_seq1.p2  ORF type:complete len:214 (+),score=45.47 gnl/MRDRNA2_/MRDRNA2_92330_c0_seq1:89-730(+)
MLRTSAPMRNMLKKIAGNFTKASSEIAPSEGAPPGSVAHGAGAGGRQHYYTPPPDVPAFQFGEIFKAFSTWGAMVKSAKSGGTSAKSGPSIPWSSNQNIHRTLKGQVMATPSWARKSDYIGIDLQAHVMELISAFKTYDVDGDGFISADELKDVMTALGEKVSKEEVERMIAEVDFDKDGKVSFEEFVKMIGAKEKEDEGRGLMDIDKMPTKA